MFGNKLFILLAVVVGLASFFHGFLPLKAHIEGHAAHLSSTSESAFVSKVVLVVVDALRADFILGYSEINWPYLSRLVESGHTVGYSAMAHPPTVTLPRIKVCGFMS